MTSFLFDLQDDLKSKDFYLGLLEKKFVFCNKAVYSINCKAIQKLYAAPTLEMFGV
jgi:hypothetical protein